MDGAGFGPAYSPSARSLPPSDPSDFSSWHGEDTTSSRGSHGMFIVNLIRDGNGLIGPPIGDHLKNKLKNMIQQKFDGFLVIKNTDQNEKGKLVTVECDLTISNDELVRIDISCNEDNTFFIIPSLEGADRHGMTPEKAGEVQRWIEQVSNFGMSGACMSLSAFLHYGFNVWKQSPLRPRAKAPRSPTVEAVAKELIIHDPRRDGELANDMLAPRDAAVVAAPLSRDALAAHAVVPGDQHSLAKGTQVMDNNICSVPRDVGGAGADGAGRDMKGKEGDAWSGASSGQASLGSGAARLAKMPLSLKSMLAQAHAAAYEHDYATCVALTSDALKSDAASWDMTVANELLLLRSFAYIRQRQNVQALRDCEQVIQNNPTCVAGYSRQAEALHGMGKLDEALEAIMCAMEYDPQDSEIQEAFTVLFNDVSRARARRERSAVTSSHRAVAPPGSLSRVRLADAVSTTTQATRLSSKSTTPTDQSPGSRSSSNDSDCMVDNDGDTRDRDSRARRSASFPSNGAS
eukprot:GEMP01020486.1.p1 GENE.GEMP01020486.1~~GEMP01020486.1.p1  ORF type:complete len:518 (+),score=128.23 GEMP01020486.1:139-1692(+)